MTDTQPRPTALHVYLGYRDAPAALTWLTEVIGFSSILSFPDADGGIQHAELVLGEAAIVVFTDQVGYERAPLKGESAGFGVYLSVPDEAAVDAVHTRAVEAGATVLWAPGGTEWGNYRCRVLDAEGYEWTVGTHRPGEPQAGWTED